MDFFLPHKVSLSEDCIWSKSLEYFLLSVVHVQILYEGQKGGKVFLIENIAYDDRFLLNNFFFLDF